MIIGIDGNEANVERKVGIGQYAFELLSQFEKFKIENLKFKIYLKDVPNQYMPEESDNWKYIVVKPRKFWTQFGLPIYLYTHKKPDVFFSPTHYAPRFSPVPTAISIMDLSYHFYPDLFKRSDLYQLENWTKYSAQNASAIFTISNASKNDIIDIYKIKSHKVTVTYPGIKFDLGASSMKTDIQEKYSLPKKYILFVGTLQPRKNIVRLFEAYKIMQEKYSVKDIDLVIVGKKGWLYDDILTAPTRLGISNHVKFLDFVPDEDMPSLYAQAECYVLPSLYEGFGLPVLEAMTYECPVATSNISSLPEAGGDAAVYFNPEDPEDIAKTVHDLVTQPNLRHDLIERGRKQVKKFSWEKTAQETLEVLEKVGSVKRNA